jgi:hypothetical protein
LAASSPRKNVTTIAAEAVRMEISKGAISIESFFEEGVLGLGYGVWGLAKPSGDTTV